MSPTAASQTDLSLQCACGKGLKVPAKLAGKRVKCPGCGQPLSVPASGSVGSSGADATARAASSASSSIQVTCSCGKSLTVRSELAGKTVKCPGCQQPLKIPATGGSETSYNPAFVALLEDAGFTTSRTGLRCPACRVDLPKETIICIECGYNLETGKPARSKKSKKQ